MKNRISSLLTLLLLFFFTGTCYAKSVSGIVNMDFDLSHYPPGKEVKLWVPYPVTDQNQNIGNIKVTGNFAESGVYTDTVFKTPMLYARWNNDAARRHLSFSFQAERDEVTDRDLRDPMVEWDPADYSLYLSATRLGPVDGKVKQLADKIIQGKKGVLAKARAIYDWTVDNTFRNPKTRGCGLGDVYRLLKEPGGKCADISSIYVALARAAGVPTREVFGLRMGKKPTLDITSWQHCWAEFYLPGHGWVSVDPADVRKMMLVQNLSLTDQKTEEYREYFWGSIDPYRIKLGEGRDLELNPTQAGEPINYLMYPFAQAGNKTLDWLDPANFKYVITYHKL